MAFVFLCNSSTSNHRIADGDLYLASADVSAAMQVQIFGEGEHVRLSALPANNAANVPSYNAAWGKGRGFGVGVHCRIFR
jgi:hypothetical protein